MKESCILLNGDYSFLGLVDWKKAMGLMFAEKVRVLKFSDRVIQGVSRSFRAPAVAVLEHHQDRLAPYADPRLLMDKLRSLDPAPPILAGTAGQANRSMRPIDRP
jgi:hypothetical protein